MRESDPIPSRTAATSAPMQSHRSEEHTSELQSPCNLECRLLLENKRLQKCPLFFIKDSPAVRTFKPKIFLTSAMAKKFFFLNIRRPPRSTLFPKSTLFR